MAATAPVFATIDVRPNLLGHLAGILFERPLLFMTIRLRDGRERRFRFIPALGVGGFVLSPMITDGANFSALASGRPPPSPDDAVVSVRITGDTFTRAFFAPAIAVTLRRLRTDLLRPDP